MFSPILIVNPRFSLHFFPLVFTIDKTANFSFTEGWYNEVINSLFLRQQSTHFHHSTLLFIHLLYLPKKEIIIMNEDQKKELAKKKLLAKRLKKAEREARIKAIKNRKPFKGLQIRPTVSLFDEADRQEPGENNWAGFGFDIHPQVSIVSVILLIVFIAGTLLFSQALPKVFLKIFWQESQRTQDGSSSQQPTSLWSRRFFSHSDATGI